MVVASTQTAAANTRSPQVVGVLVAPSGKLSDARFIGASGQLYAPQGADLLRWKRDNLGGVAATVSTAGRHGGAIYAVGGHAPIYVLAGGTWHANPLPNRGWATLATTGRFGAASVGQQIYTLRSQRWRRFGKTKGRISAIWAASPKTVYVANTHGRVRRGRKAGKDATWTLMHMGLPRGDYIRAFVGRKHVYAISQRGALIELRGTTARRVRRHPQARGMHIDAATIGANGTLFVAGRLADKPVVSTVRNRRLAAPVPIVGPSTGQPLVAIIHGAKGRLIVVTRAGHLYLRDENKVWKTGVVSTMAPTSQNKKFPQAVPARTQ